MRGTDRRQSLADSDNEEQDSKSGHGYRKMLKDRLEAKIPFQILEKSKIVSLLKERFREIG